MLTQQQAVSNQVQNLDYKVDKGFSTIMAVLEETRARNLGTVSVVRQQMPLKPRIFHGREDLVREIIFLLLDDETSRVCILGPGGVGKTSCSLTVVHSQLIQEKFSAKNRFWVPCIGATSTALFLDLLYLHLRVTRDTKNPLDDIVFDLQSSSEPRLILVDNFETPWNQTDGSQGSVNYIIRRLSEIRHVALLITMRGTNPPSEDILWQYRNLAPLDVAASRRIFQDIYPAPKNRPELDKLLAALGHMPFAVTLMAKLGKETHSSTKALMDGWSRSGTNMLSSPSTPEENMNRSIGLSVDSDLVKRDPDALVLLAVLCLLPAGTTKERLRFWAPNTSSELAAIATLSKAALVMVSDQSDSDAATLFVLPVVQSFMHSSNRIPISVQGHIQEACCKYVLEHSCRRQDRDFKAHSAALRIEETNIQSILFDSSCTLPSSRHTSLAHDPSLTKMIVESLLVFAWYRNDTQASLDLSLQILQVARAMGSQTQIGEALHCVGHTYHQLDRFQDADTHLREAYLFLKALTPDHESSRSTCECALTLSENSPFVTLDKLDDMIPILLQAHEGFNALSEEYGQARCLLQLGQIHRGLGHLSISLSYLQSGRDIMERLGREWDVARALYAASRVYFRMSQLQEALEAIKKAWSIASRLDDEFLGGDITQLASIVYFSVGQYEESLEFAQKSLLAAECLGSPLGKAQNLAQIGAIYRRQVDLQQPVAVEAKINLLNDSLAAYEASAKVFTSLGSLRLGIEGAMQSQTNLKAIQAEMDILRFTKTHLVS